jgi:6-phosphogluconolactonase
MLQKHVFADAKVLASEVAGRFRQLAERTILARGQFSCALTGGSAAKAIYGRIAEEKLDWSRVHIFWGDERMVPRDHADSNYKLAHDTLLSKIAIPAANLHAMPTEKDGSDGRAAGYLEEMKRVLGPGAALDLVHLGMGPDGHICSLFPGHRLLDEKKAWVAPIHDSPKPPPDRYTLTYPALFAAREIWFLAGGAEKAGSVAAAIEDPASRLPAALVVQGPVPVCWMLDQAAASQLKG